MSLIWFRFAATMSRHWCGKCDDRMGAAIFFWARLVHALVFIAGLPWVRTLAFIVGLVGELLILAQIL